MLQKNIENLIDKVKYFENIGFEAGGRPDLPAYRINIPFDWGIDPFGDRNWKFQLNTLRYLRIYRDLFILTKDQYYLEKHLSFFKDWGYFSQKNDHEFAWNDMATGIRAENMALLLGTLKDHKIMIPNWLQELVLLHVDRMSAQGFIKTNHNHGLYVIHGLRMLSPYVSRELRQKILAQTKDAMIELFQSQYDDNYIHKEHSPHYHHLITESLGRHLKTGLYQDIDSLYTCYDSAVKHQKNFYLPDGREIPFGDTDGANNPHKEFEAESRWEFFNLSGYFIAKNINGSYLAITNNYHSNVHKHADNLSFVLGYCGQDYLTDPGKYKYAKDQIRREIIASSSHSVINFKNDVWKNEDIVGPIIDFTSQVNDEYFVVKGSISLKRSLGVLGLWRKKAQRWSRTFFYHEKGFLVVRDDIEGRFKGWLTRFTLDPSSITNRELDSYDRQYYRGNNFQVFAFHLENDQTYSPSSFKILSTHISKQYAQAELTSQLEFGLQSGAHITIFNFNEKLTADDIMKLYLNVK